MGIRAISAGVLAIGLTMAAVPAWADTIQSGNGAYTVSWDPLAQSTPITIDSQGALSRLHLDGTHRAVTGGESVFDLFFNLTFAANPGFALGSLDISDGPTSFTYGFQGGFEFSEHTVITPLGGGPDIVLDGPDLVSFNGPGGGGAFQGIDLGPGGFTAPPGGFTLAMHQQIVVFDNSTFGFSSIDFDFVTRDAPISAAPEPAAWALMVLGFGGVGAMIRRQRRPLHPA
jgi:hypothetical protein